MKKSILICCYGIGIGGIERCMINLLNELDTSKYDIDVLPMNPEYELLESLHADVKILEPFDYVMNTTDTWQALKSRSASLLRYGKYIIFRLINKWGEKPWRLFEAPKKEYDIAIAYAHIGYVPYYVIDCVHAKKKYLWHHEGRYIKNNKKYNRDKKYFAKYDALIAVSEDDQEILLEAFPELKDKLRVLYNIVPRKEIIEKSKIKIENLDDTNAYKITTVGRLTHQKGPDLLIDIAVKLKKNKIPFLWYWIGDGDLREYLSVKIREYSLNENIKIWGNQKNPYPFIRWCDIYVQPSYYEAYCTTTLEAQILEKPIIATDVCGMREQFQNGVDGVLVSVNSDKLYDELYKLLLNKSERLRLSRNLHKKMVDCVDELKLYYQLFDS